MKPIRFSLGLLFCAVCTSALAQDFSLCGEIDFGARDYRGMNARERGHIEGAHFTRQVETLQHGKTGALGNDIDYTLRHIPNHPRALASLMKLGVRLKTERVPGAAYPVSCYFDRAVRFTPNDAQVRLVFGMYLMQRKDMAGAREQFGVAAEYAGENAQLNYNLGLVYLELGDLDAALRHARIAYANGSPQPALANRLRQRGRWPD